MEKGRRAGFPILYYYTERSRDVEGYIRYDQYLIYPTEINNMLNELISIFEWFIKEIHRFKESFNKFLEENTTKIYIKHLDENVKLTLGPTLNSIRDGLDSMNNNLQDEGIKKLAILMNIHEKLEAGKSKPIKSLTDPRDTCPFLEAYAEVNKVREYVKDIYEQSIPLDNVIDACIHIFMRLEMPTIVKQNFFLIEQHIYNPIIEKEFSNWERLEIKLK